MSKSVARAPRKQARDTMPTSTTDFVDATLKSARASLRSGDLRRAQALFCKVLERDPSQPDALYALGRIALETGRGADAIPLLERAAERGPTVACLADLAAALQNAGRNDAAVAAAQRALASDPRQLSALNTLGNALRATGQSEQAVECFDRALAIDAGIEMLHMNLAATLRDLGRTGEALDAYRRAIAIAPGDAEAHWMLGTLQRGLGLHDAAAHSLLEAIRLRPDFAEAHNAIGNLLADLGERDAAEASYRRAHELRPEQPEALYNLGDLLRSDGRLDEACDAYAGAVARAPGFSEALVRLGQTNLERGRADDAVAHFARAIALRPNDPETHCGLGNALRAVGRFDDAATAYERAVRARSGYAEAHCNLSTVCLDQGRTDAAIEHARRAIAAEPDLPEAYWNLAQALLTNGDLAQGWRKYEYRLLRDSARELPFPYPAWNGPTAAGLTLFVTAEQGVGDEIMFASCIPDVAREVAHCVVECDARLVPLFARSFPGVQPIARLAAALDYPAQLPPPNARIAIGSLPRHFRDDPARFPERRSYLVPDPDRVEQWRARYAALGPGLKIGVSWRGGKESQVRTARSIPLLDWGALAAVPGVQLVDLQYGDTTEERAEAERRGVAVRHWDDADPLRDLDGLAAQIAALDLVVSVDNATVHLAGAIGAPTWVLLPAVADWRWMRDREDSPWYPSLRLFRQQRAGNWSGVFDRVRAALETRSAGAARHGDAERPSETGAERRGGTGHPRAGAPRRTEWVALLNDTSHWYHWGCSGTSGALIETLTDRGYVLNRIPISGLYRCTAGPRTLEEFDDPACFERFVAANAWVFRELDGVDHVVINGEGSLHGLNDFVLNLLYLAYASKIHLGKDVQIVNHSCYPGGTAGASDSTLWRLYRKVYEAVDFVALREPESFGLMSHAGISAVESFDCLPLYIARHFTTSGPRRDEIVVAGSVALRESDVAAWTAFAERVKARGTALRVLIGASMLPAADDAEFVRRLVRESPDAWEVVEADRMEQWLDTLARAAVVVSGRFHHTIAAATLGTPFVLLESNTQKNAGLASVLGAPPPKPLDAADLVEQLVAGVDSARAPRADLAAELCAAAMRNFLRLPPLG